MNLDLLGFRISAWLLELDEKWLPTRQPEDAVRKTGFTRNLELGAKYAETFPDILDCIKLNAFLRSHSSFINSIA